MKKILLALLVLCWAPAAYANVPCTVPNNLINGTTADATQVMANYNAILSCLSRAAIAGANNDITSLGALSSGITNANLAQMAAYTAKCNGTGSTTNPQDCTKTDISITDFGAKCDGTTDDTTAINNAINAAISGNTGFRKIRVPWSASGCAVSSTIVISTNFVRFEGDGGTFRHDVGAEVFGPSLKWIGAAGGTVVRFTAVSGAFNQYITGMGWDGISIQCGNSAAIGLDIESVHFGAVKNYYGNSCTTADLKIAAVATLGEGNSSQLIDLTNIGGYNGNLGSCILLDGNASGNASFLAPRNVSCTYMNGDGILLNVTDNVVFTNVQETRLPGGTGAGVHFSGNNSIPFSAQNIAFYGLNPGAGGVKADGTPTLTQATASNAIYGYDNGNGAPLPVLGTGAQLFCTYSDGIPCGSSAMVAWTPTIASTVGAFGSTQLLNATYQQLPNKIYFIALSFKITAIGTAAGAMTFTLPSTISQDTVITGVDASTGRQTVCNAAGGSTSLFCTQYDATFAYMTNDTIRIMGWYPSF